MGAGNMELLDVRPVRRGLSRAKAEEMAIDVEVTDVDGKKLAAKQHRMKMSLPDAPRGYDRLVIVETPDGVLRWAPPGW